MGQTTSHKRLGLQWSALNIFWTSHGPKPEERYTTLLHLRIRYKSCSGYDMMKAFHRLIQVEGKKTPPFADPPGVWGAFLNCLTALDRLPFRPGPDGVRAWLGSELVKPFQPLISKSWYSSDSFLRFIWSLDDPTEEPFLVTMSSSSPSIIIINLGYS